MQQRQCVCVHVGQCGVQIGNAIWELFCIEHGINPDGTIQSDKVSINSLTESSKTFFLPILVDSKEEKRMEKAIPRVVMVDLEPTVLDEIRVGQYKDLYHPDQLIAGKEDAANNYARGHNTVGKDILENVQDSIKKVVEQCDNLQGFILFHSGGGGTGSGFGSLLFESMTDIYSKRTRLEILVHPAPKVSSSVVEPYNFVLSTHSLLNSDYSNCTFVVDNEALYDICQKKLDIERPSYPTLNRMLAQIVSSMTASLRFDGVLNVDLSEFHVNLVPFPRLRFPMTSYSPIISHAKVNHEQLGIHDITSECFSKANQLVKCDITNGRFLACCLLYRGDIAPKDIKSAINTIKGRKNIRFVEWCPTGFKIGINRQKPSTFPSKELAEVRRAVCLLANTTAVADIWTELGKKFDLLFSKKAFVHWFLTEGMDEEQFLESRSHFEMVKLDYLEVQKESNSLFKPRESEI